VDEQLPEVTQKRVKPGWTVSQWANRLIEHAKSGCDQPLRMVIPSK
jgi:hypothetical protein